MLMFVNKELKKRRRQQREWQKCIGFRLVNRTTTCITPFLYISLPSLHDHDVKLRGLKVMLHNVTRDIATRCCTKNRRCELSRVTSPYTALQCWNNVATIRNNVTTML